MAAHLRTQLRQALADLLVNQVSVDGDTVTVFKKRAHAVAKSALPVLFITCNGDDATSDTKRKPFINDTTVEIEIELCLADDSDENDSQVDDLIDDACLQVQHLVANAALAGAKWVRYAGTRVYRDEENEDVMRADIRFTAFFMAYENAMDTAL